MFPTATRSINLVGRTGCAIFRRNHGLRILEERLRSRRLQPLVFNQFSSAPAAQPQAASDTENQEEGTDVKEEYVFIYPKAEALFDRITSELKSADEARHLADEVNRILGRPIRKNEFYYTGFGGRRAGGGGKVAAGASAQQGGGEQEQAGEEQKSTVDLKLSGFDAKSKIKVIKEVRAITSLGLKEAKELVENAPTTIQKDMKIEEAEELKKKFEELGAEIELA